MGKTQEVDFPWELPRFRNWVAVAKVHVLVEKLMTAQFLTLDLKLPHYDIMANIFRFPNMTQQELANRLVVGRSNLSMLLPELERRGLVVRKSDSADKRIRRLFLTDKGVSLTRDALAIHTRVIENVMQALSTEECEQLGDYMRRIGAHLVAHGKNTSATNKALQ
jgi:MarR family transcriptional regulator, organic hydroperoxide resistance regulator